MNKVIQELMKPYPNLLDQFKRFLPEFVNYLTKLKFNIQTTETTITEEKAPLQPGF